MTDERTTARTLESRADENGQLAGPARATAMTDRATGGTSVSSDGAPHDAPNGGPDDGFDQRGGAALDPATAALVRLSAILASGSEAEIRRALQEAVDVVPHAWVEELLLQTYLFAGIPRALNAAREWRRASGAPAPRADEGEAYDRADEWRARGEVTCAAVYGPFYDRLRHNIRELHPALDAWMIVEGYGKVLSREPLDLRRRELCVVATCAALRQDRQLHSHLHGALHVGASPAEVGATLAAVADLLPPDDRRGVELLWTRVRDAHVRGAHVRTVPPAPARAVQPER